MGLDDCERESQNVSVAGLVASTSASAPTPAPEMGSASFCPGHPLSDISSGLADGSAGRAPSAPPTFCSALVPWRPIRFPITQYKLEPVAMSSASRDGASLLFASLGIQRM